MRDSDSWLRDRAQAATILEARLDRVVRGGVRVLVADEAGSAELFMPASLSGLVNGTVPEVETLPVKVVPSAHEEGVFIASHCAVLDELAAEEIGGIAVGDLVTAVVTGRDGYGVFVRVGAVQGLIHTRELYLKGRPARPRRFRSGSELEAIVVTVDHERLRLGLSLKRLTDRWRERAEALVIGGEIEGRVTNVVGFGAFIELAPGVEGLLHRTQLTEVADPRALDLRTLICKGERRRVRVRDVDLEGRRVTLDLVGDA